MLICPKYIYLMIVVLISTLTMVVQASATTPPVGKSMTILNQHVTMSQLNYGFMEDRIVTSQKTQWCKKFLKKREAAPHSAPFIVSIQMRRPDGGSPVHYCAGTIINENWILTAAHCLTSRQVVENSVIIAGCHDIHDIHGNGQCTQMREIHYYAVHELYLGGVNPYDIALIYTREPFHFNQYVKPAQLPEQDYMTDGYGTLYGWGNVSMTAVPNFPHKLQEANMPILDMEICEKLLAASGYSIHETNLCTGPLTGGVSICTADSGGPLVQQQDDYLEETYQVIGIVSWGKIPCGQKNAPSVFVRVSAFTNWIHQIISTATHFE